MSLDLIMSNELYFCSFQVLTKSRQRFVVLLEGKKKERKEKKRKEKLAQEIDSLLITCRKCFKAKRKRERSLKRKTKKVRKVLQFFIKQLSQVCNGWVALVVNTHLNLFAMLSKSRPNAVFYTFLFCILQSFSFFFFLLILQSQHSSSPYHHPFDKTKSPIAMAKKKQKVLAYCQSYSQFPFFLSFSALSKSSE